MCCNAGYRAYGRVIVDNIPTSHNAVTDTVRVGVRVSGTVLVVILPHRFGHRPAEMIRQLCSRGWSLTSGTQASYTSLPCTD